MCHRRPPHHRHQRRPRANCPIRGTLKRLMNEHRWPKIGGARAQEAMCQNTLVIQQKMKKKEKIIDVIRAFSRSLFQVKGAYASLHCRASVLFLLILCDIVLLFKLLNDEHYYASICWFRICCLLHQFVFRIVHIIS